jgi:hypothetical protein
MRSLVLAGFFALSTAAAAQPNRVFDAGNYNFLPRTSAYDPQFDAWRVQVAADSFRVLDPGGGVFLVSVTRITGDTLTWTDVAGPCTGVVSSYRVARDSVGVKFDVISDACSDRAAAIVNMYMVRAKAGADSDALQRERRLDLRR